ncbi:MAG: hypothetical protein OEW11_11330 [Nitrospirota bacterium]|nr:hypothetical protein [Nitrospirota bacterium]
MNTRKNIVTGLLALLGFGLVHILAPTPAEAIPAFARANKVPCTTCHVQFPKLNEFGMAFKQNGYRMQGQMGTPVWLRDNLPLAALTRLTVESTETSIPLETPPGNKTAITDAKRRGLEFFSAGHLAPRISYFFDYAFTTDTIDVFAPGGGSLGTTTVSQAGPGGTFLVFSDLVPNNLVNLRVGDMSNEFLYLSQPRRTTQHAYLAPVSVGHVGVELNGHKGLGEHSGLRYAAGYGNNGEANAEGILGGGYAWGTWDIAGQTLGARYSTGRAGDAATGLTDQYSMLDLNTNLRLGQSWLVLAWFSQDNVDGVTGATQKNLLGELVYPVTSQLLFTGRYETKESETLAGATPGTDTATVIGLSYYIMPNINLTTEFVAMNYGEGHPNSALGNPGKDTIFAFGFQVGL